MILSTDERAKLRCSIEESVHTMTDGPEKKIVLTILALIHDLDEVENRHDAAASVEASIQRVMRDLSKSPLDIDAAYVQNFTCMAENLNTLAETVWRLKTALEKVHSAAVLEKNVYEEGLQ